jgi:hypothetical protein
MFELLITLLTLSLGIPVSIGIYKCRKGKKQKLGMIIINYGFMAIYIAALLIFLLVSVFHDYSAEYYEQIDPVERGYTALAGKHLFSFTVYYALYLIAMITILVKERNLSPLILSLCIVFIIIGVLLNGGILVQYFNTETGAIVYIHKYSQNTSGYIKNGKILDYLWNKQGIDLNVLKDTHFWLWRNDTDLAIPHHILNIILSFWLIIKIIRKEKGYAENRYYKNKILNKINTIIGTNYVAWAFLLLIPIFVIITLILVLFGQEKDSMIKIWTETTTWTFSQYSHPEYLEHEGHYLCTVAAYGHPRIVKPLRLGRRRGEKIIVNRQLMVANAYEEMIKNHFPKFHQIIRYIYDHSGYPLYKYITNKYLSDVVYILMKPLEYFFLINLYFFDLKPEKLINRQYL